MTTIKQFMGRNVFIALRPNIYNVPNEHVTLEYIGHSPDWNALQQSCEDWNNIFALHHEGSAVTVAVNGYANWRAKDDYHNVALVEFKEYPNISYTKNWHITLESSRNPLDPYKYDSDEDAFRYDYCDRLWIGYKDLWSGEKKWIDQNNAKHLVKSVEIDEVFSNNAS